MAARSPARRLLESAERSAPASLYFRDRLQLRLQRPVALQQGVPRPFPDGADRVAQQVRQVAMTTGTTTWSTESIDERERFAFWREMVCRNVFNVSVQAPPKRFSASITARSHGAFRFALCESTSYDVDRTKKDISNESADHS